MERIVAGKIRIPKFQRPFVWRQQDVYTLLDSVFRGYPIGSILVWETDREIESASRVGPIEIGSHPSGLVSYLLDGQQRVSTLVGTLQLQDDSESIRDGVDWRVYFDLESEGFVRAPREGATAQYFPLASLLDTSGFLAAANRIANIETESQRDHWLNRADHLANAFRDYQLPLIRIREASLNSAVTVFARLNRTGRKISADQMVSALTYRQGDFHLSEAIDNFQKELRTRDFGNFDRRFLFRAVLAALGQDIYASDWADLVVRDDVRSKLPGSFESATKGITRALDFLEGLGVTSDRLLPYGLQLVLLGEFYGFCSDPEPEVVGLLERWFWVTSFTGWFGGSNPSKVRHALGEIRELARGERASFKFVNLDEQALPFPDSFDGRSARVRAFMLYLSSLNPRPIRRQEEGLGPNESRSILRAGNIGYVWKEPSVAGEFSSIPANRIFLEDHIFGNAFDPLRDLEDDDLKEVLPSHGFPEESLQKLRDGDRKEFIRMRQENLIRGEREFMEEKQVKSSEMETGKTIADSDTLDTVY